MGDTENPALFTKPNPYFRGTRDHALWQEGYDAARAPAVTPAETWCRAHGKMDACPEHCPQCRGYFHRGRCAHPMSQATDRGHVPTPYARSTMNCPIHGPVPGTKYVSCEPCHDELVGAMEGRSR